MHLFIWLCPINCISSVRTEKKFRGGGLLDHHLAKLKNMTFCVSLL